MRDLKKHPITLAEMRIACNNVAAELDARDPPVYGDLRPAALRAAAQRLLRLEFACEPEWKS